MVSLFCWWPMMTNLWVFIYPHFSQNHHCMWYLKIIKLSVCPYWNLWSPSQMGQWVLKQCLCIIAINEPSMNHSLHFFFFYWKSSVFDNSVSCLILPSSWHPRQSLWLNFLESLIKRTHFFTSFRRTKDHAKGRRTNIELHWRGVLCRHWAMGMCLSVP